MLQLQVLRQNPQAVKDRLAIKHFAEPQLVDEVIVLDEEVRHLKKKIEDAQMQINTLSAQIPQLHKNNQKEEAEKIRDEVVLLKSILSNNKPALDEKAKVLDNKLVRLPNLPSAQVPVGKTQADNVVVREGGIKPQLATGAVPHWDLIKQYDIVDFETGAKITGSGFALFKGKGAKLQRALIQYFLDYNTAAGYTEYHPPFMVNEASAHGTGQLPDKEGQMYYMPEDKFYMIPTSEVPVTNIYREEMVKEESLPIKMTAYSPCFRREAGSFGKDVRGLNRVHQFEKVEIVQLVHPDKSYEVLDEMVNHIEKLLSSLELPYRILRLCGGDMGFASAITYDFEVYSAAQERWLEVSSVSNFETFQSNRMKIRFKDSSGKSQLVHTLNGSSLALPRIIACLLENNQFDTGINIPKVLKPYLQLNEINTSINENEYFISKWSEIYTYSTKYEQYYTNINKNYFTPSDLQELFIWKNNMRLSDKKNIGLETKIISKISYINGFKNNGVDESEFHKLFYDVAPIWKIFLLHILNPISYPIFDQHVYRAMKYFQTGKIVELKGKPNQILEIYQKEYKPFFEKLSTTIEVKRKVDMALWAFGKFLKSRYSKFASELNFSNRFYDLAE